MKLIKKTVDNEHEVAYNDNSTIERNIMKTTTSNGMANFDSTNNKCLDLFFNVGAYRNKDIIPIFKEALSEDVDLAIRISLWGRDIRGGAGERSTYRKILSFLSKNEPDIAFKLIEKTVEIGRFDDLLSFFNTDLEVLTLNFIHDELMINKNSLCAKWMPRKGDNANKIRKFLNKTPKEYRKLLVGLTNVVEQKMCSNAWEEIEFGKLPSVASSRYQSAFKKHVPHLYQKYVDSLNCGKEKINASAIYPYDIIKSMENGGDIDACTAQWNSLPNYMEGTTERILPVVDVSGSMTTRCSGSTTCMDVAISLGLYISERNVGQFKDKFITFSETPTIQQLSGTIYSKYKNMQKSDWGMSTDLNSVFKQILDMAKFYSVPEKDMPTKILILSDMQFNTAIRNKNATAMGMISSEYEESGYKMPSVIFWNLDSKGGVPTTSKTNNVALVSGFSPSIMKSILKDGDIDPISMVLETVKIPRYDWQ